MQTIHITSSIRRKPRTTYKSPSGDEVYPQGLFSFTAVSQKIASSSSSPKPSLSIKSHTTTLQINGISTPPKRKKYPMSPPLPLYHPLGRLALSLPPLDPASVGLPTPVRSDDAVRRSSARARRPAAKLRDVEEEESPQPAPATIPDVATLEVRERPSPRKRRNGGGGVSKRKRKEVDDGDATYPAKRTRIPRGTANQNQTGDEESESTLPNRLEVTPTPEPTTDTPEDKKPERRSTRSRGIKRRDSSASDAASSVSISIGAAASVASTDGISNAKEPETMDVDTKSDGSHLFGDGAKEEKEDGELSEEGRSNSNL